MPCSHCQKWPRNGQGTFSSFFLWKSQGIRRSLVYPPRVIELFTRKQGNQGTHQDWAPGHDSSGGGWGRWCVSQYSRGPHLEFTHQPKAHILRGFKQFGEVKYAANHAFYEVSSSLEKWNTPRITHSMRFQYVWDIHTFLESWFGSASWKLRLANTVFMWKSQFSGLAGEGPRKPPRKANAPREVHWSLA